MQVIGYAEFVDRVEFNIFVDSLEFNAPASGLICLATDHKPLIAQLIKLYDSKNFFRGVAKEGSTCLIHPSTVTDFVIS